MAPASAGAEMKIRCPACRRVSSADQVVRRAVVKAEGPTPREAEGVEKGEQAKSPRTIAELATDAAEAEAGLARKRETDAAEAEAVLARKREQCFAKKQRLVAGAQKFLNTAGAELRDVAGQELVQRRMAELVEKVIRDAMPWGRPPPSCESNERSDSDAPPGYGYDDYSPPTGAAISPDQRQSALAAILAEGSGGGAEPADTPQPAPRPEDWTAITKALTELALLKGPQIADEAADLALEAGEFQGLLVDMHEWTKRALFFRHLADTAALPSPPAPDGGPPQNYPGRPEEPPQGLELLGSAPGALAYRCLNCGQEFEVPAAIGEKMNLVQSIHSRLRLYRDRHFTAQSQASFHHHLVTIPTLFFSATITIVSSLWPEDTKGETFNGRLLMALISGANTILISMGSLFGFQGQTETHGQAAKMYETLLTSLEYRVEYYLNFAKSGTNLRKDSSYEAIDDELASFVADCEKRIKEIDANMPVVPRWVKDLVNIKHLAEQRNAKGQPTNAAESAQDYLRGEEARTAARWTMAIDLLKLLAWAGLLCATWWYYHKGLEDAVRTATPRSMPSAKVALRGASRDLPRFLLSCTWWQLVLLLALVIASLLLLGCCLSRASQLFHCLLCTDVVRDLFWPSAWRGDTRKGRRLANAGGHASARPHPNAGSYENSGGNCDYSEVRTVPVEGYQPQEWSIVVVGRAIGRTGVLATQLDDAVTTGDTDAGKEQMEIPDQAAQQHPSAAVQAQSANSVPAVDNVPAKSSALSRLRGRFGSR